MSRPSRLAAAVLRAALAAGAGAARAADGADESPGRLLRGAPGDWRPTVFEGRGCRDPDAGPGRLVRALFARRAAAEARATRLPPAACEGRAAGAGR